MCTRYVQDLQLALEKARSALQEREELLRDGKQERERQDEETERTIGELRTSLQTKEQLIEVRLNTSALVLLHKPAPTLTNIHRIQIEVTSQESAVQILFMLYMPNRKLHS